MCALAKVSRRAAYRQCASAEIGEHQLPQGTVQRSIAKSHPEILLHDTGAREDCRCAELNFRSRAAPPHVFNSESQMDAERAEQVTVSRLRHWRQSLNRCERAREVSNIYNAPRCPPARLWNVNLIAPPTHPRDSSSQLPELHRHRPR